MPSIFFRLNGQALLCTEAFYAEAAWTRMYVSFYPGQKRATPIFALVKALTMAHDEAPVLVWPLPPETAPVGQVALGVAAAKLKETAIVVGVATTTTATAGVAAVMGAEETRRALVANQDAALGVITVATTGAVAAALREATEGNGMARMDVQGGTARQPPPAYLRPRGRTTAR